MPNSTVASESAFSVGGRVIDRYRSSLNPETAEALICAQDWIRRTRIDLELGSSMKNKEIDEFNEKMTANEGVIDVDDQNDEVEVPEKENKPKLTSVVWEHFPYKKGAKKSKCNHCKKYSINDFTLLLRR
ncbi:hypothetical protein LXL04_033719 [Taraxacum kok-saghyz]